MGYILHCVPGNHAFDEEDTGKRFITMPDPRYPPGTDQNMNVYACSRHEGALDGHCGRWTPHDSHPCPGTPAAPAHMEEGQQP